MVRLTMTIDEQTLQALKRQAERHHRTVEEEVADILRRAVQTDREAIVQRLKQLHAQMGALSPDKSSAELIREDRDR